MPDEKRIKDFEPATELLIDDWFAVDSPSQGTRKMQASMFQEGLQTQITTNTENIALHSGQISVLQQGVGNIGDKVDVLDAAITVEAYSASKLYAVGEDCVYEGVRYKCITAIETPEAFDPNKWQAISIEGELNELNSSLNYINYPIKRANNKSLGLDFLGFGAQIDSSRVLVIIPFPFIMNDTNYSVSIDGGCNLIGIASIDKTQVSIDTKKQTGVRLIVPYTGTVRQGYAVQIPMTITY